MAVRCYQDLIVWKKAMELAVASYRASESLPEEERYALSRQIRRAAASVPANIAEGNGRLSRGAYLQHLRIARGSLVELETHLELARRLGYLTGEHYGTPRQLADQVGRMLTTLMRALQR